jgi:hypothetical protein
MGAAYLKGSSADGIPSYRHADPRCTGKVRFESAITANRAAKRRKNRIAYRCNLCGHFHVGSDGPEPTLKAVKLGLVVIEESK